MLRDQKVVDEEMEKVAKDYKEIFEGIGKYRGPPVEIQVKERVRPTQEDTTPLSGTTQGTYPGVVGGRGHRRTAATRGGRNVGEQSGDHR